MTKRESDLNRSKWRFLALVIPLVCRASSSSPKQQIKLGVAIPWSGGLWDAGPRFAAGITIAVDRINSDPSILPNHTMSFVWKDSQCKEESALQAVLDMYTEGNPPINAIIGPACSDGCKIASMLATHWNIPIVSYGCAAHFLSDVKSHPNFARTVGVYSKSGELFVSLMRKYQWERIAILTPLAGVWTSIMTGVRNTILNAGLTVSFYQNYDEASDLNEEGFLAKMLERAREQAHVFLLGGYTSVISKIMTEAQNLGMTSAGYVFFTYELLIDDCQPQMKPGPEIVRACAALEGILDVSLFVPQTESYNNFSKLVRKKMEEAPFFRKMDDNEPVEPYAAFLHDAALLYAFALRKTLEEGGNVTDGRRIVRNMLNMSFLGESGEVNIDEKGDRASALQIRNVRNFSYHRVANFYTASSKLQMLNLTIVWPGRTHVVPIGRPRCGFQREFCPPPSKTEPWVYALAGALSFFILILMAIFLYVHYKRKAFENALLAQQWKVKLSDVQFSGKISQWITKSVRHGSMTSQLSLESDFEDSHGQIFTRIGLFQGNYVAIKQLRKTSVALNRDVLLELKQASDLLHQNINTFVGACVEPPKIFILTGYCNKGSVQDVIYNEALKLDWMFQVSIASDIARGMQYLHKSDIGVHGNLKSSNCVIDSRWVCKITDFGLFKFKSYATVKDNYTSEDQYYTDLLWKAPEHIENAKYPYSQQGDVYSYGIILQEIIVRGFPYSMFPEMSAKEIIDKVKARSNPPFRPKVISAVDHNDYMELMTACWHEEPQNRPNFDDVMKSIKKLNGGKNINIVDNMINMMEKYTDHLEELVLERTKQLEEEKAKTDELLYRMLPRSVAEQLKQGLSVKAETFESVTIFFSDIVGFTKLAAESTPLQVVDFLNDLYTCFDKICDTHHVYKVETIGDAYMVVSGLPVRNGNKHAGEIARMSLDLLSATTGFRIRHRSDLLLQLRIGIHSGPCVAGVVGLKMPRYCLFGDTVNYASRMESSGLALRIHVSPECRQVLDELGGYHLVERGPVSMKGKGTVITYFLAGYDGFDKPLPDLSKAAGMEEHTFK